jgi:hypothetical protein
MSLEEAPPQTKKALAFVVYPGVVYEQHMGPPAAL